MCSCRRGKEEERTHVQLSSDLFSVSLKKRKLVEQIFGWAKTVGGLRKTRFIGLAKVKAQTVFTFAAYNLTRLATILGWRLNSA